MKQTIYIITLIAMATLATAGSIEGLEYEDKWHECWWWHHEDTRTTNDYDVGIDADLLEGQNMQDIQDRIDAKPDLVGGGGVSFSDIGKRLFNNSRFFLQWDFMDYLKTIFATQERLDYVQAVAMYGGNRSIEDLNRWAGLIRADRTNQPQQVDGFMCHPGADRCIYIN